MSFASAQVEKGKMLLGGTTAFSFSSTTVKVEYDGEDADIDIKQQSMSFSPILGYFVIDNLAVGLDLTYTSDKSKEGDSDWSDPETRLSAGIFGRYYLGSSSFKPFAELNFGYMSLAFADTDEAKFAGLIYGGGVGADYFLNNNVALELGISYKMGSLKNKAEDLLKTKPGSLNFGIGVVVTFGGE